MSASRSSGDKVHEIVRWEWLRGDKDISLKSTFNATLTLTRKGKERKGQETLPQQEDRHSL